MQSPFPGVDPFLEACGLWEGFHERLIAALDIALAAQVPGRYFVEVGVRFYVVTASAEEEDLNPAKDDVGITTPRLSWTPPPISAVDTTSSETGEGPITMEAFVEDQFRETFIEIRELAPENRLVTTIEILSPSNKAFNSPGWRLYVRKRQACFDAPACNFIELDLLRGGQRMPMRTAWPASPHYCLVKRLREGHRCHVWPAHSLRPLPLLVVPLLPPDPDVRLPLQPLLDEIYTRSRYGDRINYRGSAQPPLTSEEAAWLQQHLPPPTNGPASS